MSKKWIFLGLVLPFFLSGCVNQPQYSYWKRNRSAPYHVANDSPAAQSRLRTDFAECSTYSYVNGKNETGSNLNRHDEPARMKSYQRMSRWDLMSGCMYTKGWTYVTAGYGKPLSSNSSLDPFKGIETNQEPPLPPQESLSSPAVTSSELPPVSSDVPAAAEPHLSDNMETYGEPIEIQ